MKKLALLGALTLLAAPLPVLAQTGAQVYPNGCGTGAYATSSSPSGVHPMSQDSVGQLCGQSPADVYTNITTGTTTTVKTSPGTLHGLTINTYVASATITLYDSKTASGTKIGTITLPSTITGDAPTTLVYDVHFSTGLTVVTSGATDITVSSQ